jgi:hypothetical protein
MQIMPEEFDFEYPISHVWQVEFAQLRQKGISGQ